MIDYLKPEELEELRRWPTCTVSNAIELFDVRPRNEGCMSSDIKCIFPELEPMIGYAVTGIMSADSPEGHQVSRLEWLDEILKIPAPRVLVIHDVDRPVVGSFWGEVQANVHRALGCVAAVTDGSVRDLDEVRELGFHFFSSGVTVTHGYVHLIDIGVPVKVGGLTVKPGDLIMGDKHGIISIPKNTAKDIPEAATLVEDWERKVINYCQSEEFTVEGLKKKIMTPKPTWPTRP